MLCITYNSIKLQSFLYTQQNGQTVLFQTIQFCKSHLFIWILNVKQFYLLPLLPPGSNGNKGVLHIPQIAKTGDSPSDCLLSYSGHTLGKSYPTAEMQSVYSTAPSNWAEHYLITEWFGGDKNMAIHLRSDNCSRFYLGNSRQGYS